MSEANRAGKSDRAEVRAIKIELRCSNFEGVFPFRGEAQNCGTVKFLLVSPTYERGLELSLINFRAEWEDKASAEEFLSCCTSRRCRSFPV